MAKSGFPGVRDRLPVFLQQRSSGPPCPLSRELGLLYRSWRISMGDQITLHRRRGAERFRGCAAVADARTGKDPDSGRASIDHPALGWRDASG